MLRCVIGFVFVLMWFTPNLNAALDRSRLVELLSNQCGVSPETFAAAGFNAQGVVAVLDDLESDSGLPDLLHSKLLTLAGISEELASCQAALREKTVFDDDADHSTIGDLEAELATLILQHEDLVSEVVSIKHQLRVEALSQQLSIAEISRITGEDSEWARVPLQFRFGSFTTSELRDIGAAFRQVQRYLATGQAVPSDLASQIYTAESQYQVSLAQARLDSYGPTIQAAVQSWIAD